MKHELVQLAGKVDWDWIDAAPARVVLYSFQVPEGECIGKGKAAAPCEFGIKSLYHHQQPAFPRRSVAR
jgi:hypothetical protein